MKELIIEWSDDLKSIAREPTLKPQIPAEYLIRTAHGKPYTMPDSPRAGSGS